MPGQLPGRMAAVAWALLLLAAAHLSRAADAQADVPRIAIIGGGVGGTAAAYFLRQAHPGWHIELFERECIGGRAQEVTLDGKVVELGASIIHGSNTYMLSLARQMNLTLSTGDDTSAAFSIWDGKDFVFAQTGSTLLDLWAVASAYGITPLRYKWLSQEAGRRFNGIYKLQQQGAAFGTPEEWLIRLGLHNMTQQSAADYMSDHLTQGVWRYGAGRFIEELAGAINRINYNQNNQQLNALAGLVSYLPAADPEVYSIKEGNAALPNKLTEAAGLQGLHVGTAVQSVSMDGSGQFTLTTAPATPAANSLRQSAALEPPVPPSQQDGQQATGQQEQQTRRQAQGQDFGPFDAVILATPLESSGLQLQGLDPSPQLPQRSYQRTTTSFVTGYLDATFFNKASLEPDADGFVTNSARTPFTVVASKGTVSVKATPQELPFATCAAPHRQQQQQQQHSHSTHQHGDGDSQHAALPLAPQQQRQQERQPLQEGADQIPLWKVFSEAPLSWHDLRTLFVNGTVVASKSWAAYPRFQPPERFAPFWLGPGLCYNNALENAASAMEVAAVAAKNCALLVQQHIQQQQQRAQQHAAAQPVTAGVTVE